MYGKSYNGGLHWSLSTGHGRTGPENTIRQHTFHSARPTTDNKMKWTRLCQSCYSVAFFTFAEDIHACHCGDRISFCAFSLLTDGIGSQQKGNGAWTVWEKKLKASFSSEFVHCTVQTNAKHNLYHIQPPLYKAVRALAYIFINTKSLILWI